MNKKFSGLLVVIILVLLSLGWRANAQSPLIQESINFNQELTSQEPLVLAGQSVHIDSQIKGDVYVLANSVVIDGTIEGDLTVLAQELIINGRLAGDLRAVTINTKILGQVTGITSLLSFQTSTDGDLSNLFLASAAAIINGKIDAAWVASSQVTVNGEIDNLHSHAQVLSIGEQAHIKELRHVGRASPFLLSGAVVDNLDFRAVPIKSFGWFSGFMAYAMSFISLWLFLFSVSFLVYYFGNKFYFVFIGEGNSKIFSKLWTGIGVILFSLALMIVLLLSRVVWWLAIFDLTFIMCAGILGLLLINNRLGHLIQKWIFKKEKTSLYTLIIGSLATAILLLVPILGLVIMTLLPLVGVGNLTILAWRARLKRQTHD